MVYGTVVRTIGLRRTLQLEPIHYQFKPKFQAVVLKPTRPEVLTLRVITIKYHPGPQLDSNKAMEPEATLGAKSDYAVGVRIHTISHHLIL